MGIVFDNSAQRVQIKDLLNDEENRFILNRLQAGRYRTPDGYDAPYRLSDDELVKLQDEYIYIQTDGDCWYARFEKPTSEIRELLGLPIQSDNPFDMF